MSHRQDFKIVDSIKFISCAYGFDYSMMLPMHRELTIKEDYDLKYLLWSLNHKSLIPKKTRESKENYIKIDFDSNIADNLLGPITNISNRKIKRMLKHGIIEPIDEEDLYRILFVIKSTKKITDYIR